MQNFKFGKYKHQSIYLITQIDVDYCMWVINNVQWKVFTEKQLTEIEKSYYKKYGVYPLQSVLTAYNIKYNDIYLKNMSNEELYELYNKCLDLQWAIKKIHQDRCLKPFNFRQPVFQTDDVK